jgi:gas vesicle protein
MVLGALIGFAAGAFLASGPGREQVDSLRMRTIELTGRSDELKQRARWAASRASTAVSDPNHPVGKAIQDGMTAAKRRRQELDREANTTELGALPPEPEAPDQGPTAQEGV